MQIWAVVVAQLAKRSLPMPEIRRSNPDIAKIFFDNLTVNCNCSRETKMNEKEAGNGPFKKSLILSNSEYIRSLVC